MHSTDKTPTRRGHLNLAADFAADAWFPGNRAVAESAAALLSGLETTPDRETLVATVKSDFSVFAFVSLHLSRKANLESAAGLLDEAPLELIRNATTHDLIAILRQASARCGSSPSGLESGANDQRIRHALVSASSAEIIAASVGIKPETAYTCALFRQIGSALIAWNYPQVYRRALTLVREDASLDSIIGKILGFTPTLLGLTIAQRWSIAPELLRGMGDRTTYARVKESALVEGDRLNEICSLGEAIAQSTEPAAFPAAAKLWPETRAMLERVAGDGALLRLRDTLAYNARVYLAVEPPVFFLPPEIVEPALESAPPKEPRFATNLFAQRCPEPIQSLFRDLYTSIEGGRPDSAITALLQSIAPTVGFKAGCVFLHEVDTDLLKPRFTTGNLRPVDYPTFRLSQGATDPVTVTFLRTTSHEPLREGSSITGVLGQTPRAGVLKLVAGPELRGLSSGELELLFRAFRKAL